MPPRQHALTILEFLQGPGGRTGTLTYREMLKVHGDVCLERDWELIRWDAVGRELGKLPAVEKALDYDATGKRGRVYRIAPKLNSKLLRIA